MPVSNTTGKGQQRQQYGRFRRERDSSRDEEGCRDAERCGKHGCARGIRLSRGERETYRAGPSHCTRSVHGRSMTHVLHENAGVWPTEDPDLTRSACANVRKARRQIHNVSELPSVSQDRGLHPLNLGPRSAACRNTGAVVCSDQR